MEYPKAKVISKKLEVTTGVLEIDEKRLVNVTTLKNPVRIESL